MRCINHIILRFFYDRKEKIELDIQNVIANSRFEGFILADEEIEIGYKIRRGEKKSEDIKEMYLGRIKSKGVMKKE